MKALKLLLFPLILFAGVLVRDGKIASSDRIYLGSFLANGHLPPNYIYEIDAFLESEIVSVFVKPFEHVKKGQKLISLKSPKLMELESQFIENYLQARYYAKELTRLKPLIKEAIVAKRRYLEAQNSYLMYKAKADFYEHLLQEWGLGEKELSMMKKNHLPAASLILRAPIEGDVSQLSAKPLMYVKEGDHLLTLIDPTKTHIEVAFPVQAASMLKKGQKIYVNSKPASIESIAPTVDAATQSVAVHIIVDGMKIFPNQRINVSLYLPKKALKVAASAVIEVDGEEGVFVKQEDRYRFVPIKVLARNVKEVYFLSDRLKPGMTVAVSGVIALKGSMEGGDD